MSLACQKMSPAGAGRHSPQRIFGDIRLFLNIFYVFRHDLASLLPMGTCFALAMTGLIGIDWICRPIDIQ
jgi:hypothetical protein